MAMRPRGGAQVPRSQFIVRPTYDDFEPKYDQKEEPTAHILHVHLPGFTREQLKVTYVESARKIKVRGERPLGNYRWSRFEKEFSIPESCVGTQIKGKFEKDVLMITMPKKVIITPLLPQEPEANKTKPAPAQPKKPEQAVPPNPASGQMPKQDKPAGPSSPNKATTTSTAEATKPQKGKQDHPQKPSSAADLAKSQRDDKASSPPKVTNQTRPQKGEQDHPLKPTSAADLAKTQRDDMALSPPKVTNQTRPQKGEQDRPQKPTSPVVKSESGPQNAQNQNPPHPKPTLKDGMKEAESVAQDYGKKKKETQTSEGHPRTGHQEMPEMSGSNKRIEAQHVTAYAKQVLGKLAKRLKEDEDSKQSLINAGVAAIVILAMGTYIAYTIASRDTQN